MKKFGFFISIYLLVYSSLFSQNQPDRGQYALTITPKSVYNWGNGNACGGSHFSLRAIYSGQSDEKEISDSYTELSLEEKETRTNFSLIPPVVFSVDNKIEKLIFHSKRKHREWGKCVNFREGENTFTLPSSFYPCSNQNITRGDNGENVLDGDGSFNGEFNVQIKPWNIKLFFQDVDLAEGDRNNSYILPSNRVVKIKATTGFPRDVYQWQYKKGSSGWQAFPDHLISLDGAEIVFYGKDLLDIREIYEKVPVSIAINSSCIHSENIIELQPRPSAPTYLKTDSIIGEQCTNSQNGKLYFTLSRDLLENEFIWAESILKDGTDNVLPLNVEKQAANRYLIYGLAPGDYTFGITGYYIDQYNQEVPIDVVGDGYSFEGSIPTAIPLNFSIEDVQPAICAHGNEGQVTIKAWGGSGTYRVLCKNSESLIFSSDFHNEEIITLSGLQVGNYQLWIEDSNGCSLGDFPDEVIIEEPQNPLRIGRVDLFRPITGLSNGSAEVQVENGKAPFQAVWRYNDAGGGVIPSGNIQSLGTEGTISRLSGVSGGSYYVAFTDAQGCHVDKTVTLEELPPFDIDLVENKVIHCYGESTGELKIGVQSGGIPPYTYQWYRFENPYRYPVGTGTVLSGISAGWYQVKITDSVGNEIWTSLIEQTQGFPVDVTFQSEILHCHGGNDGYLEASLSGGSAPYSYRWLTGDPNHTELRIESLSAGNYQLEITDANGCRQIEYGTVSEPADVTLNAEIANPSCTDLANGNIRLIINGGTLPYNIQWATGEQDSYISNLTPGSYRVAVTDKYGCKTLDRSYTLVEPNPISLSVKRIRPVTAFGKWDGSGAYFIEGGTPPYRVTCQNENRSVNLTQIVNNHDHTQVVAEFNSLQEGNYLIMVKDANFSTLNPDNCVAVDSFQIKQPPVLEVNLEENHFITCYKGDDGQLTAHASGGVPQDSVLPYLYKWYRLETGNKVLLQEGDSTLSHLSFGQYQVEVIDQNGVSAFSTTYSLQYLSQIQIDFTAAVLACSSDQTGWARASVRGGTGNYLYHWSSGDTIKDIENVRGGKYQLTVTDGRGCQVMGEVNVTSPNPLKFGHEIQTPLCTGRNEGAISLNISGGTSPYTYLWSTGSSESYLTNLYQGEYRVKITDARGCFEDTLFTLSEPDPVLAVEKELIPPKAYGYSDGSLSVLVSGGTKPYQLFWTNEAGVLLDATESEDAEGNLYTSLKSISKGTSFLRVEDQNYQLVNDNSCACLYTISFYVPEPPQLEVEIETSHQIRCYGTSDGEIVAHAQGGVPFTNGLPYIYQWYKDGKMLSVQDSVINQLSPGEYRVLITDANGIEINSSSIYLTQPDLLKLELSAADLRCSRDLNGWVEGMATGGTAPYSYHWSTGDTISRINQVSRGKYFVLVTDNHDCTVTGNTEIVQPGGIKAQVEMIQPKCYQGSDGAIRLTVSGGQPPYRYQWDNGDQSLFHQGLTKGQHSITITDVNECSHEVFAYELGQPDSIIIDLGRDWELCRSQALELNAVIPEPAQSYSWFDSSGNKIASGSSISLKESGTYRAEVLTAKGCKGAGTITITRDNIEIAADFVVASQVPIHEEVLLVNISNPEPDNIEWIIPDETGSFDVIDSDLQYLSLLFHNYGQYRIGMKTYSGKCEKIIYKTIQVMNKEDIETFEDADEPMLKQFLVSPNPNKGDFTLAVELKENSPVLLQLVNSGTGQVVEKRYLQGAKSYKEHFHLHGAEKGAFILNMFSPKAKTVEKVVIH